MRRHLILVAAASAACLLLASCSSSGTVVSADGTSAGSTDQSTSSSAAESSGGEAGSTPVTSSADGAFTPGGTVITRLTADAGTLDPALSTVGGQVIDGFLYDALVRLDDSGAVVSGLAEKWDFTADSATFTLREGITCSDGHELTASDVKANYDHLKDPDTHATWIVSLMGTTDYTVESDDATRSVTITMPAPYGDLVTGVVSIGIVCPAGLADPSTLTSGSNGTGPYVIESATPDVEYVLKAREGYTWGPDGATNAVDGFPSRIVWKVVPDDSTAVNMFTRGELNLLSIGGAEAARLSADPNVTKSATFAAVGNYMVFNQLPGRLLTGDKLLREALAKATNRQDLLQVATDGLGHVNDTLVSAEPTMCDDSSAAASVPSFDIEGAKKILDEDGWTLGSDGIREKDGKKLSLTLLVDTGDGSQPVWEYLQHVWSTELGIDGKIVTLDTNTFTERLLSGGEWDAMVIQIITNKHSTWTQFLMGPQPPDGLNLGSGDPTYEKLATQAAATPGQDGCDLWVQAEKSVFESVDVVPLYVPEGMWAGNKVDFTVQGATVLPLSLRTVG